MSLSANVRLDHELLAVERDNRVHCMLELVAPPVSGTEPRPPLHLALVIDRSGSMAGPKLETARSCAAYLARRLAPEDQLAVITFDDTVQLNWPLQPVADEQVMLDTALRTIYPGGSTNLSGGWLKGVEQLASISGGAGPKKVLLLTDGHANQGVIDQGSLVAMARNAADHQGVASTTIGFGDGFDEVLLTLMADAGGGNAYYAATPDEAPGIFSQEFEGLVSLVAQNLSVEVRPGEHVQMLGVLNDYPAVAVPGGLQFQMGDVYGEERRRVVFELLVPEMTTLGPVTVAEVIARYVGVADAIEAHELRLPVTVNLVSADEAAAQAPDAEVVDEVVILKSARAQEDAREHAMKGEFGSARKVLEETAEELRRQAPNSARIDELMQQAAEVEGQATMMTPGAFDQTVNKTMRFESYQLRRGRKRRAQ